MAHPRGNALGRARVRLPHVLEVAEDHIDAGAVDAELARLHEAIGTVRAEMLALRDRLQGALAHEVGDSSTCTRCCSTIRSCCADWTN